MAIKAVLNILVTLAVFAIFAGIGLAIFNTSRGQKARPGALIAAAGAVLVVIGLPLNAGLVLVEPFERGVVFRQVGGGEIDLLTPLSPGLQWVIPFVDQVTIYDVSRQSVTMSGDGSENSGRGAVNAISSDGQVVRVDVTVVYALDALQVNDVHRNWRGTYADGLVVPQTRSQVRNAISNFSAENIYSGGRQELEIAISEGLQTALEREGFTLVEFLVRNIEFSSEFANAIEQKQIAEQEAQRAVFLVQQAEQEAEQRRTQASGIADSNVIESEGEALSIIVRAEAEAEALELISQILAQNPNLIQYEYINELGDQVQLIIVPSDSPFLFDLEELAGPTGGGTTVAPSAVPTAIPDTNTDDTP